MVTKLKNSNCDKTQIVTNLKCDCEKKKTKKNSKGDKTQVVTKPENSGCDKS